MADLGLVLRLVEVEVVVLDGIRSSSAHSRRIQPASALPSALGVGARWRGATETTEIRERRPRAKTHLVVSLSLVRVVAEPTHDEDVCER